MEARTTGRLVAAVAALLAVPAAAFAQGEAAPDPVAVEPPPAPAVAPGSAGAAAAVRDAPPEVRFAAPDPARPYGLYDALRVRVVAVDAEDGPLPGASVHWRGLLHTPWGVEALPQQHGAEGILRVPYHGDDTWLEVRAVAVDSAGSGARASLWLTPRTAPVTVTTDPEGGALSVDGVPRATPYTWWSVVDSLHAVTAPAEPDWTAAALVFARWTNEPAFDESLPQAIAFTTPRSPLRLTATYGEAPAPVLPQAPSPAPEEAAPPDPGPEPSGAPVPPPFG
jgi:hypothetical protein